MSEQSTPAGPVWTLARADTVRVLLVAHTQDCRTALERILSGFDCVFSEVHNYREARNFLCHDRTPVILCECSLPDGCWKDVLSLIAPLPDPPALIVSSRQADERMWAEALNLGAFDVLAEPFRTDEVTRVVRSAWNRWKTEHREYELPASITATRQASLARASVA